MTAPDIGTAYRLTEEDERTIREAMAAAADEWMHVGAGTRFAYRDTLERIGAHSIGCGLSDLREPERAWLEEAATACLVGCAEVVDEGPRSLAMCGRPGGHAGKHRGEGPTGRPVTWGEA